MASRIQPSSGNDAVQMGMEEQVLSPGVEDGGKTHLSTQMLLVPGDRLDGGCRGLEELIEYDPFVSQSERIELVGQREDHMKVGGGQKSLSPGFKPLCLFQVLALRTMTISARVIGDPYMSAGIAGILMASQSGRSAGFDMPHHGELTLQCLDLPSDPPQLSPARWPP